MAYRVEVTVTVDDSKLIGPFPTEEALADHAIEMVSFALGREDADPATAVSVAFVPIERIAELNSLYRGKDGPTDVLSFPLDAPDDAPDAEGEIVIGDIAISPEVAIRQNAEYGTTFVEEIDLLLTHGTLHLLGYDHIEDEDALVMEARERDILAAWRREDRS